MSSDCSVVAPAGGGVGAASPGPHSTPQGIIHPGLNGHPTLVVLVSKQQARRIAKPDYPPRVLILPGLMTLTLLTACVLVVGKSEEE